MMTTRNKTTDELIILTIANAGGEITRRDLTKKAGHRIDFDSALWRLERTGRIELLQKQMRGRKPQFLARLIGQDDILLHGVGFARLK